jgi:glycosyltransferase involved in cell wall biosynthesis
MPVISTDAGGIKELIRHNLDGLLCPVDQPEKLVEYAIDLLQNKDIGIRLGAEARRRVENDFGMRKMVKELEDVYSSFRV